MATTKTTTRKTRSTKSPTAKATAPATEPTVEPATAVATNDVTATQSAAETPAPAAKEAAATTEPTEAAATSIIFVRSRGEYFHRAGYKFTAAGFGIALDVLTEEQLAAVRNEPELIVEDGTVNESEAE